MSAVSYRINLAGIQPDPPSFTTKFLGIKQFTHSHYLVSLEESGQGLLHAHIVIEPQDPSQVGLSRMRQWLNRMVKEYCVERQGEPLLNSGRNRVSYLTKHGGAYRFSHYASILSYFLRKVEGTGYCELTGRKTYITRWGDDETSAAFMNPPEPLPESTEGAYYSSDHVDGASALASRRTYRGEWLEGVVNHCIRHGNYTEEAIKDNDRSLYYELIAKGVQTLSSVLLMIRRQCVKDFTLGWFLGNATLPEDPSWVNDNLFYKLFLHQGYSPKYASKLFARWSSLDMGKRNTIAIYGPTSTGKSLLQRAVHACCPLVGQVTKTSETFPFQECPMTLCISWDEGRCTSATVDTAKQLMGGEDCEVAQKGRGAAQVPPTPVLMTTNHCPWHVYDMNAISNKEEGPLKERMTIYHFRNKVRFNTHEFPMPYPCTPKQLGLEFCKFVTWGVVQLQKGSSRPMADHYIPE